MTSIDPTAEAARELARSASGQFGTQENSAPEATLAAGQPLNDVLSEIAYIHDGDSILAEDKAKQARLESFVADAKRAVPDAAAAQFVWEHNFGDESRLVFDAYLDEDGEELPLEFEDHPDISDFHFIDNKYASASGFDPSMSFDGATLPFTAITVRDEAQARAELSVASKLQSRQYEPELRTLLISAMSGDDAVSAERVDRLNGYDLEQVEAIFASALQSTANYLRHS